MTAYYDGLLFSWLLLQGWEASRRAAAALASREEQLRQIQQAVRLHGVGQPSELPEGEKQSIELEHTLRSVQQLESALAAARTEAVAARAQAATEAATCANLREELAAVVEEAAEHAADRVGALEAVLAARFEQAALLVENERLRAELGAAGKARCPVLATAKAPLRSCAQYLSGDGWRCGVRRRRSCHRLRR